MPTKIRSRTSQHSSTEPGLYLLVKNIIEGFCGHTRYVPKIEFWLEAKEDLHTFFASVRYNFGRKFMKFAQNIKHIDFCVLHKLHEF